MNIEVRDREKKKMKIDFQNPVGCLLNSEGGEMLSACFHKTYPPRYSVCATCLSNNFHRPIPLSAWGTDMQTKKLVNGEWTIDEPVFNKISVVESTLSSK